jgi:tRNA pseudouridine55 synthase
LDGVLVIDKPPGMTSHDVVAAVRKAAGIRRVGHAGTLDPDATGVLVVCLGRATRLVPWLQATAKTYDARIRLGATTTTLDAAGETIDVHDASAVDEETFCGALGSFLGAIEQIPPMVSAVRVGGERLHAKARRGEEVERPPRQVVIHDLVLEDFVPGPEAEAAFLVTCSPGTYVRTLAADIGERLGVGAHLRTLRRLASGRFHVDDAVSLDEVIELVEAGRLEKALLTMAQAVSDYPAVTLDQGAARALGHGRPLPPTGVAGPVAALAPDGTLVAMVEDRDGAARPLAVFAAAGVSDG